MIRNTFELMWVKLHKIYCNLFPVFCQIPTQTSVWVKQPDKNTSSTIEKGLADYKNVRYFCIWITIHIGIYIKDVRNANISIPATNNSLYHWNDILNYKINIMNHYCFYGHH